MKNINKLIDMAEDLCDQIQTADMNNRIVKSSCMYTYQELGKCRFQIEKILAYLHEMKGICNE